ncbi:MAG: 4Fe-4S dicluster domain-containing protein [Eggerthellaceae bacterium]|nr:4Fe-4S dicluster domain-containing protein [Eggerthellaceae bacterium]
MTQYGFFFDQSRCNNCHVCSIACRDWNGIEPGPVKWVRMMQWEKGAFPVPAMHTLFATCYHCENPVCVDACTNGALFKEDEFGAVLLDEDKCRGCRQCWLACPYGAPQYADNAIGTPMSKCTMCYDKLVQGELPVCVASCPQRALDFGPLEEMEERYGSVHELEDMPDGSVVKPAVVFKPRAERKTLVPYDPVEAARLMGGRIDQLPDLYDDPSFAIEYDPAIVGYNTLVMKASSVEETLARSKNEDG